MSSDILLLMVLVAAAASLANWRYGMLLIILVGMLQDPLRKLTPGAPALMAVSALPIWMAMSASLYHRDRHFWSRFRRAYPKVSRTLGWFVLSLVPPILLILGYGLQAWRMAVLGGFAYLAPLLTMVAGFSFAQREGDIRRLLGFYATAATVMLIGSPLEYLGLTPDWPVVGTRALGAVWIRFSERGGDPFLLVSGFFRSPDIMGWHAAMLVMVSVTLGLTARRAAGRAWMLLAVWGAFSLLVAGRRKMIIMPAIWLGVLLLAHLRGGRGRGLAAAGLATGAILGSMYLAQGEGAIQSDYYAYARSTITEAPSRFLEGSVGAVWQTLLQSGILGRGLGSATQGAQHLGAGPGQSWQESGFGKLAVELGAPGFLCGIVLATAVGRACYAALVRVPLGAAGGLLQVALVGIILANVASFIVSHQAYGDLLIATLTAFVLGLALSGPRWASASAPTPVASRQPAWPLHA